jgi:hypothetical protein
MSKPAITLDERELAARIIDQVLRQARRDQVADEVELRGRLSLACPWSLGDDRWRFWCREVDHGLRRYANPGTAINAEGLQLAPGLAIDPELTRWLDRSGIVARQARPQRDRPAPDTDDGLTQLSLSELAG